MNLKKTVPIATAIAPLAVVFLQFLRYVRKSAFYGFFGLKAELFPSAYESYIEPGWLYVYYTLGMLVIGYYFYRLVLWVGKNDKLPPSSSIGTKIKRGAKSMCQQVGPSALYLAIFLALSFVVLHVEAKAKEEAQSLITTPKRVVLKRKSPDELPTKLYFINRVDGKILVFGQDECDIWQVRSVNEDDITEILFIQDK